MWMIIIVVAIAVAIAGLAYALRRGRSGNRRDVSIWATGQGLTYTQGTSRLFDYLRGAPYEHGYGTGIRHVATGDHRGIRVVVAVFDTRLTSGENGAPAVTVALALPGPVPELAVRRERAADRARGRDLQLESEQFNAEFRIDCAEPKFAYDVLSPTMMQFLLADQRAADYRIRFDGTALVIWRNGTVRDTADLDRMLAFGHDILQHTTGFAFRSGWTVQPGQTRLTEIPPPVFGQSGVGAIHERRTTQHRGRTIEMADHLMDSRGMRDWFTVVSIDFPTPWPTIMVSPKKFILQQSRYGKYMQPRYDDEVLTGNTEFDEIFAVGSPRPDFVHTVLTPDLTGRLLADRRMREVEMIFVPVILRPGRDNVTEVTNLGRVEVSGLGLLSDEDMARKRMDLLCDIVDHLPEAAFSVRAELR